MSKLKEIKEREDGIVTLVTVFLMLALTTMLAITIDFGNTYFMHIKMRNALELAAVSVSHDMPVANTSEAKDALRDKVTHIVYSNGLNEDEAELRVEWTAADDNKFMAVRLWLVSDIPQFFGGLLGTEYSHSTVGCFVYVTRDDAAEGGYQIHIIDTN